MCLCDRSWKGGRHPDVSPKVAWKQSLQSPYTHIPADRAPAADMYSLMVVMCVTYLLFRPAGLLLRLHPALWLQEHNATKSVDGTYQGYTHTRWMPSWPVRDHQTAASSASSQQRCTGETSGYGFLNKIPPAPLQACSDSMAF